MHSADAVRLFELHVAYIYAPFDDHCFDSTAASVLLSAACCCAAGIKTTLGMIRGSHRTDRSPHPAAALVLNWALQRLNVSLVEIIQHMCCTCDC